MAIYDVTKKIASEKKQTIRAVITSPNPEQEEIIKEGIGVLEQEDGAHTWGISSSPMYARKGKIEFFFDSFALLAIKNSLKQSTLSLFNCNSKTLEPEFTKKSEYNMYSGLCWSPGLRRCWSPTAEAAQSPASGPRSSSRRRRSSSSSSSSRARWRRPRPRHRSGRRRDLAGAVRRGGGARHPPLPTRHGLELRRGRGRPAPGAAARPVRVLQSDDTAPDLSAAATPVQLSSTPEQTPDVDFFLLDGYGRSDQLEQTVGFDNAAFLAALTRRGFEVHDDATAAYPVTFLSLAATLSMDYPAEPGELRITAPSSTRSAGTTRSSTPSTGSATSSPSPPTTRPSTVASRWIFCIEPSAEEIEGVGGEREVAIMGATPLTTLLPALGIHISPLRGYLSPEDVVREVARERSGEPVFAYAHILAPHPPYRYLEGCALREDLTGPEIDYWGEAAGEGGEGYRQAIEWSTAACCARSKRSKLRIRTRSS